MAAKPFAFIILTSEEITSLRGERNKEQIEKSQISPISWRDKPGGDQLTLDSREPNIRLFEVP